MADTLDILTEAEATRAVNYTTASGAALAELVQMNTAVSRDIDRLCGPVVQRSVTERASSSGGTSIWLTQWPVASVTTITEYTPGNAAGLLLTADDEDSFAVYGYLLDIDAGLVLRRSNGFATVFPVGVRNIVVVYSAGRYANTAAVDAMWKAKAATALARKWREEAPLWARSAQLGADIGLDEEYPGLAYNDRFLRSILDGLLLPPTIS